MAEPNVTIVVVPRERFNLSGPSLDSIYEHTETPFELVYVDGNSPRAVRDELAAQARARGFQLVRTERYLTPNRARNLGFQYVTTPYVVFCDNDLFVTPGWLDRLIECAEETGAWLVGPLYFEGDPKDEIIHMAGGDYELSGEFGHRTFSTTHRLQGIPVAEAAEPLRREACDFVEFHCMLARTDELRRLGPLDEKLMSTREHLDLCMQAREAGGGVWFEPASRVTYHGPPPVEMADVPFFWLRWSDAWSRSSLEHFCGKYGIDPGYVERMHVMRRRRQVVFDPVRRVTRKGLGETGDKAVAKVLLGAERVVNNLVVRDGRLRTG